MTANEQGIYLSTLLHKVNTIERTAHEFKAIISHYLDRVYREGDGAVSEAPALEGETCEIIAEEHDDYIQESDESCQE